MAKRFTDNDIWKKQRWFRKLTPNNKLIFFYIKDQCTHWGIWKIDCIDLMEDTGIEGFDLNEFVQCVNTEYDKITGTKIKKERIIILPDNNLWVTSFLQFQWENKGGRLNIKIPAVKTALSALLSLGLLEKALHNRYITLIDGYEEKEKIIEFINNGWRTVREENRVGVGVTNLNKNENGTSENSKPINFAAQGADVLVERVAQRQAKIKQSGIGYNTNSHQ